MKKEEKDVLSGLFREDFSRKKQVTIKLEKLQKAIGETKFEGISLEDILQGYFSEEIISNKKERLIYLNKREKFFNKLINKCSGSLAALWLDEVINKQNNAYYILSKRYNIDQEKLKTDIRNVAKALNSLPVIKREKKPLALFASEITKNPHAFDQKNEAGLLLQYALMYYLNSSKPQNAEERAELFYNGGILVDEVSNYTLCAGLEAI